MFPFFIGFMDGKHHPVPRSVPQHLHGDARAKFSARVAAIDTTVVGRNGRDRPAPAWVRHQSTGARRASFVHESKRRFPSRTTVVTLTELNLCIAAISEVTHHPVSTAPPLGWNLGKAHLDPSTRLRPLGSKLVTISCINFRPTSSM